MSNVSVGLVPPRYRHFFPIAPQLLVELKGLRRSNGIDGVISSVITHVAEAVALQKVYVLPPRFNTSTTPQFSMYVDQIYQSNNYGWFGKTKPLLDEDGNPILDENGNPDVEWVFEYELFDYDPVTESITLTTRMPEITAGLEIKFEVEGERVLDLYTKIDMRKYLIQGANPVDGDVVNPLDPTAPFFQGGYRCTLQLLSRPLHGVVEVAPDRLGFLYRPEIAYYGGDSFAYRIINCMGQESDVVCLYLQVG